TTLLHRLLAADPARRALASWEALSPAPPPPRPWHRLLGERDPRQLTAAAAERTLSLLAPDFFAVHPVEADAPEEEVVLMDHTFVSQVSEASYHVPSFASWVVDQDHRVAYRHLRRCLQVLRFQRPEAPAHWVLKSPAHLEQLDALLDVFPDARIIQTHRDPRKTVASFCSMVAHGRGVFSDSVDPLEIGRHWLAKVHRMVTRASQSRQRRPEVFFDVAYLDLVADPVAKAAEVAAFAGRPLSEEAKTRLAAWHGQNPQHRFGRHVYTASDFGLSDDGIANTLADYVKEYGIESE
ncbi:MAG: sulfotransferase, partial [Myxococcales bacterium]|nr:sulfotransferase [Myxococcales bacterium]